MVTIPTVAVDPAGIRDAADRLRDGGVALAEQADLVIHTWLGLGSFYVAPETRMLMASLDPVGRSARDHRERLAAVHTALDAFADEAEAVVRGLDNLRARADRGGAPPLTAGLGYQADLLLRRLRDAEEVCAAAVRAALDVRDELPSAGDSGTAFLELVAGDRTPLGASYLDTPLEAAMLTHFVNGTGQDYVLSAADLDAARTDPAVVAAGAGLRAGRLDDATAVVLEGGQPGYRVDVDFKQPVDGRTVNPFDGSIGRARAFFDSSGNFVGMTDSFDFTNGGNAVDLVNLTAGTYGSEPFRNRGGIIEERPVDQNIPVRPDADAARDRLFRRNVLREDPGSYTGPPRN